MLVYDEDSSVLSSIRLYSYEISISHRSKITLRTGTIDTRR